MANSVQKLRGAAVTPLGFVKVTTPGTPVCIMNNLDPANNSSPKTATGPYLGPYGADVPYSPAMRGFGFQGFKQNADNTVSPNTGNVYILVAPAGVGSGNNQDTGAMVKVLPSGYDYFYPPEGANIDRTSPYFLFLDADTAGDGAIVVAYGASGG
jgi:hypothetical protein